MSLGILRVDDTPWSAFVTRETLIILRPQRAWAPPLVVVVKVGVVKVAILFTKERFFCGLFSVKVLFSSSLVVVYNKERVLNEGGEEICPKKCTTQHDKEEEEKEEAFFGGSL